MENKSPSISVHWTGRCDGTTASTQEANISANN